MPSIATKQKKNETSLIKRKCPTWKLIYMCIWSEWLKKNCLNECYNTVELNSLAGDNVRMIYIFSISKRKQSVYVCAILYLQVLFSKIWPPISTAKMIKNEIKHTVFDHMMCFLNFYKHAQAASMSFPSHLLLALF